MRAIDYERFAGIDGLEVVERPAPTVGPGTVVIRVMASSINPATLSALNGAPYVPGRDLAGEVVEIGDDVDVLEVGDAVLGRAATWWAHAELVAVPVAELIRKPEALSWDVAGSLYTPTMAALAGVQAVAPQKGELIVVSGASGAVGLTAAQLARRLGADVIGLAGADKLDWLAAHDITGLTYGPGEKDRILDAAQGRPIDGLVDTSGAGSVAMALDLGVPVDRVNTVVDFAAGRQFGVSTRGTADAGGAAAFRDLADQVAEGALDFPIAATYPLGEVREAYREIADRRPFGRVVLRPQE